MDIWQHIIRPGDVWGRFTLYLKQNGQAAVQREVKEGTLRVIPLSDAGIFHDISFIYLRDSIYEQDMENLFAALSA